MQHERDIRDTKKPAEALLGGFGEAVTYGALMV